MVFSDKTVLLRTRRCGIEDRVENDVMGWPVLRTGASLECAEGVVSGKLRRLPDPGGSRVAGGGASRSPYKDPRFSSPTAGLRFRDEADVLPVFLPLGSVFCYREVGRENRKSWH